jgi:hypothetical protein
MKNLSKGLFWQYVHAFTAVEQLVGRERRERVSHHDWSGDA